MTTHTYAVFNDKASACAAYHELQRVGVQRDRCSVLLHERAVNDAEVPLSHTHAASGAVRGAVLVGASGAAIGLVAGPVGLLGVGPLAAALFAGGVGSVYGALIGALSGATEPDADRFEDLLSAGKIIVAADACDAADRERLATVLAAHHGTVLER